MKKYIGVKMIDAEPMNRGSYDNLGKSLKDCVDPAGSEEGYFVTYEDGCTSWSPKDVFDRSYFPIEGDKKISKADVDLFMGEGSYNKIDEKTLLVSVESKTGFVQHEAASCVDPSEFNTEIGIEVGMDNIRSRFWGHLGFVLQWAKFGLDNNK